MPVASTGFCATAIGATNLLMICSCVFSFFVWNVYSAYIQSGRYKKVLLIGADKMSSIDYTDRSTCIIFCDGAGAVYLSPIMKV
jgi:3-oxoacyl-[acyl-carrier-protein] synthase-3